MAKLLASTPMAGLMPMTVGTTELSEVVVDRAALVAPFAGQDVSQDLQQALGVTFPQAGQQIVAGDVRAIWFGGGQALVLGAIPDLGTAAAVTDQSDAWAIVQVAGPQVTDVLARLVPIDLRAAKFPVDATARTLVGHMTASVTRMAADKFEIMVMRSMASTLAHDLERAAKGVASRG